MFSMESASVRVRAKQIELSLIPLIKSSGKLLNVLSRLARPLKAPTHAVVRVLCVVAVMGSDQGQHLEHVVGEPARLLFGLASI